MCIRDSLTGSNTNPTLQKIEEEYAPIFSAHSDNIYPVSYTHLDVYKRQYYRW